MKASNILLYLYLLLAGIPSLTYSTDNIDIWWPKKCGVMETTIVNEDTLLTEYLCRKNGRYIKRNLKNGKYHGAFIEWNSDGKVIARFSYYYDELDGNVKRWDSTGFLIRDKKYRKGTPIGSHKEYYYKNKPKKFYNYNNSGKKHGLCETWREDGTRKDSVVYNNGTIVSARYYFDNGKVRQYAAKCKDALTYEAVFYAPQGNITGEVKDGNGTYIIYAEDGTIPAEKIVKNGKVVSTRELYTVHFNNQGKKHGLYKEWRRDGTIKDSVVYDNGIIIEARQYFFNGKIRDYTKYKNGLLWYSEAYSPTGEKLETIQNGAGIGTNYSEDGKLRYIREYRDGKEISSRLLKPGEDMSGEK
jgi:antitoxin component YwqK of YwqJK toxin-antitoxin module